MIWILRQIRKGILIPVYFIVPFFRCQYANRIIQTKIASLKSGELAFEYMNGWEDLNLEEIEGFFHSSIEQMKSLEDKARISITGITIAVSLMIGIGGFVIGNDDLNSNPIQPWVVAFGIISLSYFAMSGCMSLEVLGEKNLVYQLFPKDLRLSEKEKKEKITFNTEMNVYQNIIRNNYVYSAYRSILYAILSLSVMFILLTTSVL